MPVANPVGLTVAVSVPVPEPEAGLKVNQAALSLAVQLKAPPVLLMVTVCGMGLAPPCMAVKESAVGLAPMAGLIVGGGAEGVGTGGGDINCANPGISAANVLIDRPPVFPFPEVEELPVPAAASGILPVDAVPAVVAPKAVTEIGATLTVARGTVGLALPVKDAGSLD